MIHGSVYVCKLKITSPCLSLTDDLANHQNEIPPNAQSFRGAPSHLHCIESVPRLWYVWFHEHQQMTWLVGWGMEWKRQRSLRKRHVDRHRGRDTTCKTLCFARERAYEPLFKRTPRWLPGAGLGAVLPTSEGQSWQSLTHTVAENPSLQICMHLRRLLPKEPKPSKCQIKHL